jgi:hypothetical protein
MTSADVKGAPTMRCRSIRRGWLGWAPRLPELTGRLTVPGGTGDEGPLVALMDDGDSAKKDERRRVAEAVGASRWPATARADRGTGTPARGDSVSSSTDIDRLGTAPYGTPVGEDNITGR